MIRVKCQKCQAEFSAKDELAGRRGKCPKCQAPLEVPRPAARVQPPATARQDQRPSPVDKSSAAAQQQARPVTSTTQTARVAAPSQVRRVDSISKGPNPTAHPRELLSAFSGDIDHVRVSPLYRVGILLAAIAMLVLPLAYLAIICLAGYGVFFHATHNTGILAMGTGRGRVAAVLAYLAPIVAGCVLVFFMLKPLFARPEASRRTRSLTRQGEPLLFAFVDRICQAVGSRPPARIEVDCQLNASASFDRTAFKLFRRRLVLTIGAPLVAGLDAGQMAGVLAHEFGHFTQGAGLRLTYVVRSINFWFVRVVHERDAWDHWLAETAQSWDFRVGWILYLSQLCVWLSRRILWVFMLVGHAISSFMLRQMEFHADAHEARLVGGGVFEETMRGLTLLGVAYQAALQDLGQLADRGHLPDNLPQLMLLKRRQMPDELVAAIEEHGRMAKTGWFDSHPADRDRILRAHGEGTEPVFAARRPAADLFANFEALSRNTTWDLYRAVFGSRFQPSQMKPTAEVLRDSLPASAPTRAPIEID